MSRRAAWVRAHDGRCDKAAGFTLLEVLASMVLLALLMLGVYAGIRTATHTVHAGNAALEDIDSMRAAQQFVRRELSQARAMPWARDDRGNAVFFIGTPHMLQFVAPLPGYLGRLGPQVQTLRLVPDAEGLRLEVSFSLLPPDGSALRTFGQPQVLLRGIRSASFAYLDFSVEPGAAPDWQSTWPVSNAMPAAIALDLVRFKGAWPELRVAPRVNAGSTRVPSANLRMRTSPP